ncbi:pyridoxine 4-dehydrogenase [Streptacidiphilus sp. MAP12-33]|uniref:aldo/keto reductase n=1 Tax=Streptacidiphilus sp. MAP12-33 TaxID=3156266 RepID=UPI003518C17A
MITQTNPLPATAAGTWTLGDLPVRRIGLGTMRLAQTGAAFHPDAAPRDRDQAIGVLRRAVELGVNHVDTAAFYFSATRSANELINRALSPYRDDLVIVTKVGPGRDLAGAWLPHATPAQLRGQVEENLRQLGRDHLDVVNLRVLGDAPVAERFGALAELRERGLIRHLGLSNIRAHQLAEARAIAPVVCVQNPFGLGAATPEQEELLRACGEQGVAFVPFYSIAGSGRDKGAGLPEPEALRALAESRGVSTAQLRIAWTLHQGPHVLAIPGTGDPAHLEANVAAAGLRLSGDELAVLDCLHRAVAS